MSKQRFRFYFERQTAKISASSSGNDSKYKILTDKNVLPEKELLEKAATTKRFKYSLLGKELLGQNDTAKDQFDFF